MDLSRRKFLAFLGAGAAALVLPKLYIPRKTYFLPLGVTEMESWRRMCPDWFLSPSLDPFWSPVEEHDLAVYKVALDAMERQLIDQMRIPPDIMGLIKEGSMYCGSAGPISGYRLQLQGATPA